VALAEELDQPLVTTDGRLAEDAKELTTISIESYLARSLTGKSVQVGRPAS
jgi:hypothetical protein